MPGARASALVLAAALLAAGCTPGEDGGASTTPRPTVTQAATPGGPSPTTTPAPAVGDGSPAATGASPCRVQATPSQAGAPDEAIRVEQVSGDLDGDGAADRLVTYAADSEDPTFFLRVVTDAGYAAQAELDQASGFVDVRPLGVTGIGADRPVVFVLEGASASAQLVSLWALHDLPQQPCALRRVTPPGPDAPEIFRVGGSAGGIGGLACRDVAGTDATELVVTSATRAADSRWEWRERAWTWPGAGALAAVSQDAGIVETQQQAADYAGLDCPGVSGP